MFKKTIHNRHCYSYDWWCICAIFGPGHVSIWVWKVLITLDFYNVEKLRRRRFPAVSIDWNPS